MLNLIPIGPKIYAAYIICSRRRVPPAAAGLCRCAQSLGQTDGHCTVLTRLLHKNVIINVTQKLYFNDIWHRLDMICNDSKPTHNFMKCRFYLFRPVINFEAFSFYPHDAMPSWPCVCLCLVTSQSSIETAGFCMGASFHLSYTELKGNSGTGYFQK